jgi:Putative bacterial sensory transduction regulator
MAIVDSFNVLMIERFIKSNGWGYSVDRDGDLKIEFKYDDEIGSEMTFHFILGGQNKSIYTLRSVTNKFVPKNNLGQALIICNLWNRDHRWPNAYLYYENESNDSRAGFMILERHLNLEVGIHQELFDTITDDTLSAAYLFWKKVYQEYGL